MKPRKVPEPPIITYGATLDESVLFISPGIRRRLHEIVLDIRRRVEIAKQQLVTRPSTLYDNECEDDPNTVDYISVPSNIAMRPPTSLVKMLRRGGIGADTILQRFCRNTKANHNKVTKNNLNAMGCSIEVSKSRLEGFDVFDGVFPSNPDLQDVAGKESGSKTQQSYCGFIPRYIEGHGKGYMCWLGVVLTVFLYNAVTIPLRASFPYQTSTNWHIWLTFDCIADAVYVVDSLFVKCRRSFVKNGQTITEPLAMLRNYVFTTEFKVDVISLIPLDLLYLSPDYRWLAIIRIHRLLRVNVFRKFFNELDRFVDRPTAFRVTKMFFYMVYLIHCNNCIFYALCTAEGLASNSWVYDGKGNAYVRGFYFMVKVASGIGNNPAPTNFYEVVYMLISWEVGVFVFAVLLGQMRDIVTHAGRAKNNFRTTMDDAVQQMKALDLPPNLQKRVLVYLAHNFEENKSFDETTVTTGLPLHMQAELALSAHFATLRKVDLFRDCDQGMIRHLVVKLRPLLFLPGDYICRAGEVGKEMYIVERGSIDVFSAGRLMETHSDGAVFGEMSVLAVTDAQNENPDQQKEGGKEDNAELHSNIRHLYDVRAKGFATLYALAKEDLVEVCQGYPRSKRVLEQKTDEILQKFKEMSEGSTGQRTYEDFVLQRNIAEIQYRINQRSVEGQPRLIDAVMEIIKLNNRKNTATSALNTQSADISEYSTFIN